VEKPRAKEQDKQDALGFDYNMVAFRNETLCVGPDFVHDHVTQRPQQLLEDSLLAVVCPRPFGITADGPAEVLCHAVKKRFGIALRQAGKNVLYELFVFKRGHWVLLFGCVNKGCADKSREDGDREDEDCGLRALLVLFAAGRAPAATGNFGRRPVVSHSP